jgi:DNA-binding transcriptional ArsR family regulator
MDAVEAEDGRLAANLAASLEPRLRDALDHPFRREVVRILNRDRHPRSVTELQADLPPFQPEQLGYHLRVLREAGVVAAKGNGAGTAGKHARYGSVAAEDGRIRGVLRATERWDRQQRETRESHKASPLLTMFRTPRPIRSIRLRGGRGAHEAGSESP